MYLTEKEAWQAAVQQANRIGRSGNIVEYMDVMPPLSATGTYCIIVGQIRPPTIDDV